MSNRTRTPALSLLFAVLLAAPAPAQDIDVKTLYEAGRKAEAARDFKTAFSNYDKIMDIDEEYEDVFDRWDACQPLVEWQEALEGKPTAADLVRLGELFLPSGRIADERRAYEDAIALDPAYADAHGHLALANYGMRGGDMVVVIRETQEFLKRSPHAKQLAGDLADFDVYGELRIMPRILKEQLKAANEASRSGDRIEAAEELEKVAKGDIPDAYRTKLYTEAGKQRMRGKDRDGAKKAFEEAVKHANCVSTIEARLGLASISVKDGRHEEAVAHLRAAVAEGSDACTAISRQRKRAFKALFESEDAAIRDEMEKLADKWNGDSPMRTRIEAALERAGVEKKLVLLHAYGPYCPYVMALQERFVRPEVQKILADEFVYVKLNLGSHHRGDTINEEYGDFVTQIGVPSFMVLNPDGTVHSLEKDTNLMSVDNRAYGVEKIVEWLKKTAEE